MEIELETVIELLFLGLFLLMAILVFSVIYSALFVSDAPIEDVKQRIEFTVCGGFTNIQEGGCPANVDTSHIYMFEGPYRSNSRLLVFDQDTDFISGSDLFVWDSTIFGWDTGFYIWPEGTESRFEKPCEEACVCLIDISTFSEFKDSMCRDLDFGGNKITAVRHSDSSFERFNEDVVAWFNLHPPPEYDPFVGNYEKTPPYITPIPTSRIKKYQNLHYFLLYMYYDAENRELLITQFEPNLMRELEAAS